MKISFITTCKGRLEHLKQTLPLLLAANADEVIVVDVDCPDGTANWLRTNNFPVKIVELPMPGFHIAKARNAGAAVAQFPVLCFIDADIKIDNEFIPWIKKHWLRNTFAVRLQKSPYDGIHEQGTVVCRASDFKLVEGYDEMFRNYGGEDHDFNEKLRRSGLRRQNFPANLIASIPHDDIVRTKYHSEKDKKIASIQNRLYSAAKRQVLSLSPGMIELPTHIKSQIMSQIEAKLQLWKSGQNFEPVRISITKHAWLPEPYRLVQSLTIELLVDDPNHSKPKPSN